MKVKLLLISFIFIFIKCSNYLRKESDTDYIKKFTNAIINSQNQMIYESFDSLYCFKSHDRDTYFKLFNWIGSNKDKLIFNFDSIKVIQENSGCKVFKLKIYEPNFTTNTNDSMNLYYYLNKVSITKRIIFFDIEKYVKIEPIKIANLDN